MFSSAANFLGAFFAKPPLSPIRGLYYPPAGGEMYSTHREWVGAQHSGTDSVMATALVALNPVIHHCRIGKITLKSAA